MKTPLRPVARIAVELLGPSLVGAVLFTFMSAVQARHAGFVVLLPFILLVTPIYAALPSVLFTLFMEVAFSHGLEPQSRRAVGLAALLGLLAGVGFGLLFSDRQRTNGALELFAALGIATGAIVGAFVRARSLPLPPPREGEGGEGGAQGDP